MALNLGAITTEVTQAVNGISSSLNTLTTNTFSNASNFTGGVNAVARNLGLTNISTSTGQLNIGQVANQLLGSGSKVAQLANQAQAIGGIISSLSAAASNPKTAAAAKVAGLLKSSGLGSFAESIEKLGSFGETIAGGGIGAFNQVTVANKSAQELKGAIGGVFDTARQFMESVKPDASGFAGAGTGGGTVPTNNYKLNANGRISNPLRNHNTYNYIITLGILDKSQLNDPTSYRKNGGQFKKILLKSGGAERGEAGFSNRIRTPGEGEENAEFYIDDLEINAVVAPSPNTGTALGTNVTFKIVEPYSMGQLIEAMAIGARECGYSGYVDAPFCLKIEFCGWNDKGEVDLTFAKPSFIPIKINKMEFNVGPTGSTYSCTAVPYSEAALADVANKTKVPVSAYGPDVHSVLENSKESVTWVINGQIEKLEEKKVIKGYDRYLICFPKTKQALLDAIKGGNVDISALRATQDAADQERIRLGVGNPVPPQGVAAENASIPTISAVSAPNTYLYLKAWASNVENVNEFGRSSIIEETASGGDQPHPEAAQTYNTETQTNDRSSPSANPSEKTRKFNFNQSSNITSIIEEVLKNSTYVKELATKPAVNGFKKHFRIETMVFIEPDDGATEAEIGRPRKTYVYAVVPFWTHEARHLGPCQKPNGVDQLKKFVKKEYNYFYTGQNEDVLNFDINFNNAFFQNMRSDLGNNSSVTTGQEVTSTGPKPAASVAQGDNKPCPPTSEPKPTVELTPANKNVSSGGTRTGSVSEQVKLALAEEIHNRIINSPVDMITAEMDIWGDPYFLPSDTGNYSAAPGQPGVTADGTMAYTRDEVWIIVNFLTPLDYYIYGASMARASYVKPFSGLYQVWNAQSTFSGGLFKQKLKLIRMRGQDSQGTTNGSGVFTLSDVKFFGGSDPALNANPDPGSAPVAAPAFSLPDLVTKYANTNTQTGSNASYSQERLMTGTVTTGVEKVITNPTTSIEGALPPEELAKLPIDTSSNLGITANLTKTVFPLKVSQAVQQAAQAGKLVANAVTQTQNLVAKGLNSPLGSGIAAGLPVVAAAAQAFAGGQNVAERIQTTANAAINGLTTQARAAGSRPPTGPI